MRKVILSIRPRFFDMIALGQKTLELRKTYPKESDSDEPVEVYLYVTKGAASGKKHHPLSGKIAGKFVLRQVYFSKYVDGRLGDHWSTNECPYHMGINRPFVEKMTGISTDEAERYAGTGTLYLWKVEGLQLFETPMALGDFGIKRAPQSWCYAVDSRAHEPTQDELEDFWNGK